MTTTNQIFEPSQSPKSPAGQRIILSRFLGNISLAWKMVLMAVVLFLGTLSVAIAGYIGLQAMRYQFSNIYDFKLIPITSIQDADISLEEAKYNIVQVLRGDIKAEERASSLAQIQTDNQSIEDVIARYDTEWVTTTSPQFTQDLKNAGKIGLQQQEVADLASFHKAYDAYKTAVAKYLATVQAGNPDANLADDSTIKLDAADTEFDKLIAVNNQFADFSNTSAQAAYQQALITGVIVLVIGLALGIFLSYLVVLSITGRLSELTHSAAAMQEGNLDQVVDVTGRDEVSLLGTTFNLMVSQLKNLFGTLEQRVAERTHSLELAAEVGRSVSQVRTLDVMLKDAAELIRSRFDLYYVQVYLTDPSQTNLLLLSGTGTVGAELVGRGHRLPLNTASINGRAAIEKRSVVVADTAASATFKPNPLLPDTRSEMAVPLLIGEKVVGVLDMQSQQANALNQEILPAFEALAGQLAIAIQNANFLAETQQARAEVETQARRLTRTNWIDYLDAIHKPEETGFVFQQNKIVPMTQLGQSQPSTNGNALTAPITVTGETLGNLVVEMEGQSPIARTDELINTVAQQVARQIESLRLLDSAERYRVEAEEASRRLTREGWKNYTQENAGGGMNYIYDLKEVRPFNQNGDQQTDESATIVPLNVRDETIGKLVIQGLGSGDKESLELANTVAERLGVHIENLRLAEETEQAFIKTKQLSRQNELILDSAGEGIFGLDVKGNHTFVNPAAADMLGYAVEELIGRHSHSTWHHTKPDGSPYPSDECPIYRSINTGIEQRGNELFIRKDGSRMDVAFTATPIFEGDGVVGAVVTFTDITQQKREQENIAQRAKALSAVAEISSASTRELDIQKMLETVVYLTQRKFGLYHAHVFIYNENADELKIAACGWKEGDIHEGTHGTAAIPLNQEKSLVARAARTRQAVIVNDVHNEPGWLPNPLLPDTAAELAVPLLIGDQVLGILDVQADRINAFTEDDANIQTMLASQVATSLQNARSFVRAQQQADRESTLNAISQKIQGATTVEAALQIAARELGRALGAPRTIAQLGLASRDDDGNGRK